jgi:tetraacyldisaccharide 4'-kinase
MIILAPLGWLYGRVMQLRNALYDRGIFTTYDLGAKTISVGNITTGGTGKTPLVAYIASLFAENGEKVCVLTRGYGRKNEKERVLVSDGVKVLVDAETGGDEPVELAHKLLGKSIVVADADRVSAGRWAKDKFGVTTFVLDDAFQHRRVDRDLDIVCVDATDPFGPFLREPARNLARAHAIVLTRSEQIQSPENLISELSGLARGRPVYKAVSKLASSVVAPEASVLAFCGIGNPGSFFKTLARAGFHITAERIFPDHHVYSQDDITELESEAKSIQCEILVTTGKDSIKLDALQFEIPLLVAEIESVIDDAVGFRDLLLSV